MNRHKFRAWDKDEKKWCDYPVYIDSNGETYYEHYERGLDNNINVEINQYTGLKDKNGVEIYEGDILYFEPYETHGNDRIVEYIDGAYHGRLIRNGYSPLLSDCVYETKVIGNIYQNPELL